MIRKQIYIEAKHQAALAHASRREGTSEAAVIRHALEAVSRAGGRPLEDAAWRQALAVMRSLARRKGRRSRRAWRRDDLYEERMRRYDRKTD
jgi:hypothetical protein